MCDIWKEKPKVDLSPELIDKLFSSTYISRNTDVAITGGEPFLINMEHMAQTIMQYHPINTITTNGVLTQKIVSFIEKNELPRNFTLNISMDGIISHNIQRGKDSLSQVLKTIEQLRQQCTIAIKFVITPVNYGDLLPTYLYCRHHGIAFKPKLIEDANTYTNKLQEANTIFSQQAKRHITKALIYMYKNSDNKAFLKDTIKYLNGKLDQHVCKVPSNRLFVMPNGTVHSCVHFEPIGNLHEQDLDSIWEGVIAQEHRCHVKEHGCNGCVSYHGWSRC
jgi:molybdenum cofactor biosynthesis enzyme MoaA